MKSERRTRCYRITLSSLLFLVAAIYMSAAGVSGQQQLSCQQLTDQRCGQTFSDVLRQQPPLPAVCKAVDVMLGCTAKLLPTCDPLQAAQVAEQVNTRLIADFGPDSQPNCSLANSTSTVYQNQCNKGLNLCFFELLASAEPPGTDPAQLDTVRGCLFYKFFRQCVDAELTSCSTAVMTRVTEEVNSASAKFNADPYTCLTKQGEVKIQECISVIQNSLRALPPNEVCMLVSEVRGKCLEEAKSLADPSRAGQLEQQFNAYVAFLSQNPFNCQGPSSLPPNNDAGATSPGRCEAMASACRGPFEQGMNAAGGSPVFVCPEIDKLLGCLIPSLDQCTAISRTELVGALRQLIDYHLDPQTFNCALKNAGHPSLQQDPCDAAIFECSQMMYNARNVPVTNGSTVIEACIHYDAFVGCASDKLDVCDASRQSVFRPLVDTATRDFNDSPYFCDERKQFDIDSAEGAFVTCTESFQRESLSEKDLEYACSAVAMLEGCLVKVQTMGSPRQISLFTTATETLTAPYRMVPYHCDSTPSKPPFTSPPPHDHPPRTIAGTTAATARPPSAPTTVTTAATWPRTAGATIAPAVATIGVAAARSVTSSPGPAARVKSGLLASGNDVSGGQESGGRTLAAATSDSVSSAVPVTVHANRIGRKMAVSKEMGGLGQDAIKPGTIPPSRQPDELGTVRKKGPTATLSTVAASSVSTPAPTTTTPLPLSTTTRTTLGSVTTTLPPTTTLARTTPTPPTTSATTAATSSRATTPAAATTTTATTPAETTTKPRLGPPPLGSRPPTLDSLSSTSSATAAALANATSSIAAASTPTPPPSTLMTAPTATSMTVPAPSATPLLTSATSSGTTSTTTTTTLKPAAATSLTSSGKTSTTTASKPATAAVPPASPLNATSAATTVLTTSSPPTTSAAYEAVLPPATSSPTAATAILTLPPATTTTATVSISPSRPTAATWPPTAAAASTFPPPTVPTVPAPLLTAQPTARGASTTGTTPEPTRPAREPTVSSADEPGMLATTLSALAAEGAPVKMDVAAAVVTGKYGSFALLSAAARSTTSLPFQILVILFWGIYVPWKLTS